MNVLDGKVVVVTGSGRGIGRAIAHGVAAAGAKVVVCDYGVSLTGREPSSEVAEKVVSEISAKGGEAVAVFDTVTTMAGGARMVQSGIDTWGRVDGVVCCAGVLRHRPFIEMSEGDFDGVIETHLKGHFTLFRAAFEAMVRQRTGGSLIGISSGYVHGDPLRASYRAAKAGVVALTLSAALAGAEHGITANCISPVANTRMTEASQLHFESEPEDIAPMAVYLLSGRGRGVTGKVFSVMGDTIGVWGDPEQVRLVRHTQRWTQDQIDEEMAWLRDGVTASVETPPLGPATLDQR